MVEDRNHLFVRCDVIGRSWSLTLWWQTG